MKEHVQKALTQDSTVSSVLTHNHKIDCSYSSSELIRDTVEYDTHSMAAGASESQGTQRRNQHLEALPGSMEVWIYDLFAANTCGIQKCHKWHLASCQPSNRTGEPPQDFWANAMGFHAAVKHPVWTLPLAIQPFQS